jgi:hypothetical protein
MPAGLSIEQPPSSKTHYTYYSQRSLSAAATTA